MKGNCSILRMMKYLELGFLGRPMIVMVTFIHREIAFDWVLLLVQKTRNEFGISLCVGIR